MRAVVQRAALGGHDVQHGPHSALQLRHLGEQRALLEERLWRADALDQNRREAEQVSARASRAAATARSGARCSRRLGVRGRGGVGRERAGGQREVAEQLEEAAELQSARRGGVAELVALGAPAGQRFVATSATATV